MPNPTPLQNARQLNLIPHTPPSGVSLLIHVSRLPATPELSSRMPDAHMIRSVGAFGVMSPILVHIDVAAQNEIASFMRGWAEGSAFGDVRRLAGDFEATWRYMCQDTQEDGARRLASLLSDQTRFRMIAGRRRLIAARENNLDHIPAICYPNSIPVETVTLMENATRADNPFVELAAILRLLRTEGAGMAEIFAATGLSVQTIKRRMQLLHLIGPLAEGTKQGRISVSVAETCAKLSVPQQQEIATLLERQGRVTATMVREVREVHGGQRTLDGLRTLMDTAQNNPLAREILGETETPRTSSPAETSGDSEEASEDELLARSARAFEASHPGEMMSEEEFAALLEDVDVPFNAMPNPNFQSVRDWPLPAGLVTRQSLTNIEGTALVLERGPAETEEATVIDMAQNRARVNAALNAIGQLVAHGGPGAGLALAEIAIAQALAHGNWHRATHEDRVVRRRLRLLEAYSTYGLHNLIQEYEYQDLRERDIHMDARHEAGMSALDSQDEAIRFLLSLCEPSMGNAYANARSARQFLRNFQGGWQDNPAQEPTNDTTEETTEE